MVGRVVVVVDRLCGKDEIYAAGLISIIMCDVLYTLRKKFLYNKKTFL